MRHGVLQDMIIIVIESAAFSFMFVSCGEGHTVIYQRCIRHKTGSVRVVTSSRFVSQLSEPPARTLPVCLQVSWRSVLFLILALCLPSCRSWPYGNKMLTFREKWLPETDRRTYWRAVKLNRRSTARWASPVTQRNVFFNKWMDTEFY